MLKRILFSAAVALVAAGCGSSRNDTSSSSSGTSSTTSSTGNTSSSTTTGSSTGSTGTTSSTTSSSTTTTGTTSSSTTTSSTSTSGTTGATCVHVSTVAALRTQPAFQDVCLDTPAVVVEGNSPGATFADGGSYAGAYYIADPDGTAIQLYKEKNGSPTGDPGRLDTVTGEGLVKLFPADAGATAQVSLSGKHLTITVAASGTGTLPTAKTPAASDLDETTGNLAFVASYVTVPAATYTQTNGPVELTYNASNGKSYQDGVKLTDGSGHNILVDTFSYSHATGIDRSCFPSDGGFPDFSAGGFRGVFDEDKTDDGAFHTVVFFGDCADLH